MTEFSVVLPAYNEAENIGKVIDKINSYLSKKFKSFEIIVVDDGSTDATSKIVNKYKTKYKSLRIFQHHKNLGYGAALRSGFAASKGELIFYTDSDLQYDISDLDKLLVLAPSADIISGYRLNYALPTTRLITSLVYNGIIRFLFDLKVKDIDCSFKLYNKKIFNSINLKSNTGLIDAEILIKARKAGYSIVQTGVTHWPRLKGNSIYEVGKISKDIVFVNPKTPLEIFKEIKNQWSELKY
jgi:glycosyltransferase involved in cell wall biosynthesis